MKRILLGAVALGGLVAFGAWQAISQEQAPVEAIPSDEQAVGAMQLDPAGDESRGAGNSAAAEAPKVVEKIPDKPLTTEGTPMGKRIAVLGLLNKRNGESRELKLRPGQAIRIGDIVIRLKACETTAPWEDQKLTGAFVQTDALARDGSWRRIFSGWLFKESPSLNAMEDPIYDVWPKSCTMAHPDIGPDTVRISGSAASPSSAKKSGLAQPTAPSAPAPAPVPAKPTPSAASNSAT